MSVPGTALAAAIGEGIRALGPPATEGTEAKGRALVVVSDGEDHEGGIEQAIAAAKRAGVVVYGIGCGTDQGAPIPEGSGAYKKDKEGKLVTTRLDERVLRNLAVETGGKYYRASAAEGEVEAIAAALVRDGRLRLGNRAEDPVGREVPDPAGDRARRVDSRGGDLRPEEDRMTRPITFALLAGLSTLLGGEAHRRTEKGNQLYLEGQHEPALTEYQKAQAALPEAPQLHYDIGNVLYRQENWAGAAEAYEHALGVAGKDLSARAAYNLGNALFHDEKYDEAVKAYTRALKGAPADGDAKHNLELALRALEQQQQQQKQQPKQDPKDRRSRISRNHPRRKNDDEQKPKDDKGSQNQPKDQVPSVSRKPVG